MNSQQVITGLLVLAIVYMLYNRMCGEGFADYPGTFGHSVKNEIVEPIQEKSSVNTQKEVVQETNKLQPYVGDSDQMNLNNQDDSKIELGKCSNNGQFISSNLLPKDDGNLDSSFAEYAPDLKGKNFVDAYKFTFGSPSQSLRNANYQLRSDPLNPQENVCPWMQSTIYPEDRRKLEIGAGGA